MRQAGFTLIELLVVLVIIAVVWAAVVPQLTTGNQREGREWMQSVRDHLALSCELAAQTMTPHRLAWQGGSLQLLAWQSRTESWQAVPDALPLMPPAAWQLTFPARASEGELAWWCRPDGEQQPGALVLSHAELGRVRLSWQGDGVYELSLAAH